MLELFFCTLFTNYAQIVNNQYHFQAAKNGKCFNFAMDFTVP